MRLFACICTTFRCHSHSALLTKYHKTSVWGRRTRRKRNSIWCV